MKTYATLAALGLACAGHASIVTVDGKCNIFGAGLSSPPDPGGGGAGFLPVGLSLIGHSSGHVELLSATGGVTAGFAFPLNGPDGGTSASGTTDVLSHGGISGLIHANRTLFLVGVFLGPGPATTPAPPRLDVTDANAQTDFSPLVGQTFFMGDGRDASSNLQRFHIPVGATRLFLGFVDAFEFGDPTSTPGHYGDNGGSFRVETNVVPAPGAASMLLAAGLISCRRRRATR
jgi:hypothetical protein